VLTHLVRNAIAHGVETPTARAELGKDATGIIRAVATAGADLDAGPTIVVEDDGRGLDVTAIAERAVQLGIDVASKDRAKVSGLIFTAGFTTVEQAGQLAGRGVGLGAVRADLERVGYTIEVESAAGKYTRFLIGPKSRGNGAASQQARPSVAK
jgi:chemotaxis protein histidine kinase CheA